MGPQTGTRAQTKIYIVSRKYPGLCFMCLMCFFVAMIKLEAAQLAARIKEEVKAEIDGGLRVCLAAVRVGDDPASAVYVRNKIKACEEVGISSVVLRFDADDDPDTLVKKIEELNNDVNVDGILVQLPLPDRFKLAPILSTVIDPIFNLHGAQTTTHPVGM